MTKMWLIEWIECSIDKEFEVSGLSIDGVIVGWR